MLYCPLLSPSFWQTRGSSIHKTASTTTTMGTMELLRRRQFEYRAAERRLLEKLAAERRLLENLAAELIFHIAYYSDNVSATMLALTSKSIFEKLSAKTLHIPKAPCAKYKAGACGECTRAKHLDLLVGNQPSLLYHCLSCCKLHTYTRMPDTAPFRRGFFISALTPDHDKNYAFLGCAQSPTKYDRAWESSTIGLASAADDEKAFLTHSVPFRILSYIRACQTAGKKNVERDLFSWSAKIFYDHKDHEIWGEKTKAAYTRLKIESAACWDTRKGLSVHSKLRFRKLKGHGRTEFISDWILPGNKTLTICPHISVMEEDRLDLSFPDPGDDIARCNDPSRKILNTLRHFLIREQTRKSWSDINGGMGGAGVNKCPHCSTYYEVWLNNKNEVEINVYRHFGITMDKAIKSRIGAINPRALTYPLQDSAEIRRYFERARQRDRPDCPDYPDSPMGWDMPVYEEDDLEPIKSIEGVEEAEEAEEVESI